MNKVVADALTLVYKFLMPLCSKFNPALIERGLLSIAGEDAFDFSSQLKRFWNKPRTSRSTLNNSHLSKNMVVAILRLKLHRSVPRGPSDIRPMDLLVFHFVYTLSGSAKKSLNVTPSATQIRSIVGTPN